MENMEGSKDLKFWCTIFLASCVDFWCIYAPQKKLAPQQYFSVSHAPYGVPYRTPYCKDFRFICLQISYDLMYLKLFVITYLFRSSGNILLYVLVEYIESHSMCSLSILAKVCVCVFIEILNMATICFS